MTSDWRLPELVGLAGDIMARTATAGDSRRVRWSPNARLVRYYTTIGLLDKPSGVRGQVAHYGPRHLLQLLAIKALQTRGLSLGEIQLRVTGLPEPMLARLAGLPEDWSLDREDPGLSRDHDPQSAARRGERFWEQHPTDHDTVIQADTDKQETHRHEASLPLQGVELAPGVILLLDRERYPRPDADQLRRAAESLLQALQA